jgi:hypothetical protein
LSYYEDVWAEGIAPTFLFLALNAAISLKEQPYYPENRRLGGPQSQSGALSSLEPNPKYLDVQPIACHYIN